MLSYYQLDKVIERLENVIKGKRDDYYSRIPKYHSILFLNRLKIVKEVVEIFLDYNRMTRFLENFEKEVFEFARRDGFKYYIKGFIKEKFSDKIIDEGIVQSIINLIEGFPDIKVELGFLLSELLDLSYLSSIHIRINKSWNYLGAYNKKNLIISGDCGDYLGYEMEGGEIIVFGNSGNFIGYSMKDGKIYIDNLDPTKISRNCKGEIYKGLREPYGKGPKLVWKDGKFV